MKNGLFLLKTGIAPIFFRFEDFYNAHRMNKISASLNLLTGATCADDPVAADRDVALVERSGRDVEDAPALDHQIGARAPERLIDPPAKLRLVERHHTACQDSRSRHPSWQPQPRVHCRQCRCWPV